MVMEDVDLDIGFLHEMMIVGGSSMPHHHISSLTCLMLNYVDMMLDLEFLQ
jgi:hypothetical protein